MNEAQKKTRRKKTKKNEAKNKPKTNQFKMKQIYRDNEQPNTEYT